MAFVAPGEPREARRQHEGRELVVLRAVAQRDGARLVLADRLQHLAEGRVDDAVDEQEPGREDREHHVVEDRRVREVEETEELPARHGLDAVLAAREGRLQAEEEHHLRERQRDHREVDALAADGEQPREHAEHGGRGRARRGSRVPAAGPRPSPRGPTT